MINLVPGRYEEYLSNLDQVHGDDATRLLGWAILNKKSPDDIEKIGKICESLSVITLERSPALVLAARKGSIDAVDQLLTMGAPLNTLSADGYGSTALHVAVMERRSDVVNLLLAARAEVNIPDASGKIALHHACADTTILDISLALLENGSDLHMKDKHGATPVSIAIRSSNVSFMKHVVRSVAKPSASVAARYVEDCRSAKASEELLDLLVANRWSAPGQVAGSGSSHLDETFPDPAASAAAARLKAATRPGPLLHEAASSGDCVALVNLLNLGTDPNVLGSQGSTPLHEAAKHGHAKIVEALLDAKAEVDRADKGGNTPLFLAAKAGKTAVVRALLQGGASPNGKDPKASSPLHIAMERRHGAVVDALIDGGASPGSSGEKGKTLLHTACENGTPGVVRSLLRGGALPGHCWNDRLQSPLMSACMAGNEAAVKQLLPLLSLRQINMRDRVVSSADGGVTALVLAVTYGLRAIAIIEALLEAGADPNIRTVSGSLSPLEVTVINSEFRHSPTLGPRLVRALVNAGAEVDEVGPTGWTPLQRACHKGNCGEVVQALLDAGADPCAPCAAFQFLTPLQLTGIGGNPGALGVMIGRPECGGLNAVGASPERATVLAYAVYCGKSAAVRFLLEEGADMDLLPFEEDGKTPQAPSLIHMAMTEGHGDIISLLLQARQFKEASERVVQG